MADSTPKDDLRHSLSAPELDPQPSHPHGISINLPTSPSDGRPPAVTHISSPTYKSPLRQHKRTPSRSKGVKETLDAHSYYGSTDDGDGPAVHRINQYIIKQEIGRGSFGSVHLAEDQYGNEFAVKEFSKSRLRKRAQSNLLRKPNQGRRPGQIAAGLGFNSPLHRLSSTDAQGPAFNNSLNLIKEEIAIMKKLDHNNLVSLIEVLDDPQEDSLYMVLEMCKKGVAMKVGLDERAEPYDDETCRCWFRDMMLGIEYLHAQGIIHRDIKPDNCLITEDDVLKIVDFGVSEMFEKASEMATAKSAGSPAFMPPELCVARHGQVSGKAADIWSMGVTLYCLRYGHIPFEKSNMLELYESIRTEDLPVEDEKDNNFADLMKRLLDKNPETRITMEELRDHPWITKDGTDPLLSTEENCADIVDPPTEAEMDHAITGNMAHLLAVMSAVRRFKDLLHGKRGRPTDGIFGRDSQLVQPPQQMSPSSISPPSRSQETDNRRPMDKVLVTAGVHRDVDINDDMEKLPQDLNKVAGQQDQSVDLETAVSGAEKQPGETNARFKQRMEAMRHHPSFSQDPEEHRKSFASKRAQTFPLMEPGKGHAHDPLEDRFFLNIGHDPDVSHEQEDYQIVSESPPAVEMDIYEQAYKEEMEKIINRRGGQPSAYLTRRVEHREDLRTLGTIKDAGKTVARHAAATFDGVLSQGYTAGASVREAGRNAARAAAGFSPSQALSRESSGTDSWSELVKSAANNGLETSKTAAKNATGTVNDLYKTYSKSGSAKEGLSNIVAQAQTKARGEDDPEIVSSPTGIDESFTSPFSRRTDNTSSNTSSDTLDKTKSSLTSLLSRVRSDNSDSK